MYLELTTALRAADSTRRSAPSCSPARDGAFTSGADLTEMAAIATGTKVEGSDRGFHGLLDCLIALSVPLLAAVNGVAVGLGFTLLAHCDLVLVDAGARCRVPFAELGVPPKAASSTSSPRPWGGRGRGPHFHIGLRSGAGSSSGSAWPSRYACRHRARRDGHPGGGIAAHPRSATRAITSLMRAARREAVLEANRREQARSRRCSVRRSVTARWRNSPPGLPPPDRAPRHHRRPDRRRPRPADLAAAVEELGFDSLWLPEHARPRRARTAAGAGRRRAPRRLQTLPRPTGRAGHGGRGNDRIGLGTGILLAAQHEPIVLAKQVATLDHLGGGRVTLGVGFGWSRIEAEDHGVDCTAAAGGPRTPRGHGGHLVQRASRVPRRVRRLRPDVVLAQAGPAARVRTLVGGRRHQSVFRRSVYADDWIPIGGRGLGEAMPRLPTRANRPGVTPPASA